MPPFGKLLAGAAVSLAAFAVTAPRGHADTLRILALRVDFRADADSSITTGDGTFLLDPDGWDEYDVDFNEHPYDPPPHDGRYFESHLRAARAWLRAVSYGTDDLSWTMSPAHPDSVLHLPRMMREYYSKHDASSLAAGDRQLIGVVKAAFAALDTAAAAAGSTFAYAGYGAFIVFHAGADGRTDADDGTYADIPSNYVSLARYGDSVVTAGGTVVRDCILLPETVTQDGRIGVLNGVLAYELGHQLGLPSLYYTEESANYGVPAVGYFSLMDIGGNIPGSGETYVYGTVPPLPGPWERIRLGWAEPVVLGSGQAGTYAVNPAAVAAESSIYKIPVSAGEYFLVENRQRIADAAADTPFVVDTATGVILGPAPVADTLTGDTLRPYDALLPGDGLVVWHVYERAMDLTADPLLVNYDSGRQGIDIVEADGEEELGYVLTYGDADDMFGPGGVFTPFSDPASDSRSGAYTGISITDIDTAGGYRLKFTLAFDGLRPGWPVTADTGLGAFAPLFADGAGAVCAVSASGTVYAWQADGTGFPGTAAGVLGTCAGVPSGAPAAGDIDGDGTSELVVADAAGYVNVFRLDGTGGTAGTVDVGASCSGHPVLAAADTAGYAVYQGSVDGMLYRVAAGSVAAGDTFAVPGAVRCAAGFVRAAYGTLCVVAAHENGVVRLYGPGLDTVFWETDLGASVAAAPAVCDVDRDSASEIIVVAGGKLHVLTADGASASGAWPAGEGLVSAPAVADLDGNGYPDVYAAGSGRVYGFNRTGAPLSGYPRYLDRTDPVGGITAAPVAGNAYGDAAHELVVGSPRADVHLLSDGRVPRGWPLSTGGDAVRAGALLCDLDGNDTTDVVAVSAGRAYAWRTAAAAGGMWSMEAHDARRSGYCASPAVAAVAAGELLSPAYNYPNPVKTGRTAVRYRVGAAGAAVTVKLFDYAGELVDAFDGPAVPYEYNEIPYDVSGLQSGVSPFQVEAKAGGTTQVRFFRMAVIK